VTIAGGFSGNDGGVTMKRGGFQVALVVWIFGDIPARGDRPG
jgi:hypothetical protein